MVKKILNLPTDDSKIYKQLLAFLNFSLNATPQEREVLAEIIKLNNEYEALPPKQRAKFILSTDMRKEMREVVDIEEKQFNVIISRLRKKTLLGEPLFDDDGILNRHLMIKSDSEGIQIEINLVNATNQTKTEKKEEKVEKEGEILDEIVTEEKEERKLAAPANNAEIIHPGGDKHSSGFIMINDD